MSPHNCSSNVALIHPVEYSGVVLTHQPRWPGMQAPISDEGQKPAAKAKASAKRKAAPKRTSSDGGIRQVSTRRYSQKTLQEIPMCHIQQWLEHADSVHANGSVTKGLDKQQLLMMLTFMVGWHPETEPVESCPQTILYRVCCLAFD